MRETEAWRSLACSLISFCPPCLSCFKGHTSSYLLIQPQRFLHTFLPIFLGVYQSKSSSLAHYWLHPTNETVSWFCWLQWKAKWKVLPSLVFDPSGLLLVSQLKNLNFLHADNKHFSWCQWLHTLLLPSFLPSKTSICSQPRKGQAKRHLLESFSVLTLCKAVVISSL